jgi:hypothetical protein
MEAVFSLRWIPADGQPEGFFMQSVNFDAPPAGDFRQNRQNKALLRETGNLKLVQKALNHADIRTTSKYAHVLTDEIADAMERVTESRKSPQMSDSKPSNRLNYKRE